jgi:hypothetical protein
MKERQIFVAGGLAPSKDPAKTYHLANCVISVNGEVQKFLLHYNYHIKELNQLYFSEWITFLDSQKQIMAMVKDPATGARLNTFQQWFTVIWPLSPYNVEKL